MEVLADRIVEGFYGLLWPMLRISALLLTMPLFSIAAVPRRIRVLLGLALTLMIYPQVEWPSLDPVSAAGILEGVNQIFIGCMMGLMLQVVVAAVVVAGQALSNAVGLSMASLIDPTLGNVPILSQFLLIMSVLIFLGEGGHLILVGLLFKSFYSLPVGVSLLDQETWGRLVAWSSMIFIGGLLVSLPVLAATLVINAGLGVISRAAPSLNIFAIGFPAMLAIGLVTCLLSMESVSLRIQWLWVRGFASLGELMGGT